MWKTALEFIRELKRTLPLTGHENGLDESRREQLQKVQLRLGYMFKNLTLLDQALTHRSWSNERLEGSTARNDYEALEFLGDSILGFIISEFLYLTHPDFREGNLSKMKSHLVSTRELCAVSGKLGLGEFLNLSHGEEKTGGRTKRAILADLFESVVAAIYLDGDIEAARDFVLKNFQTQFEEIARGELKFLDFKSALQEKLHSQGYSSPRYEVIGESGPDHAKIFEVCVISEGDKIAEGSGKSKKEAEQAAARHALGKIGISDRT